MPQALVLMGGPGWHQLGQGLQGWREVVAEGLSGPEAWLCGLGQLVCPL